MKDTDRQLDLSAKFLQMGQALMDEGRENDNRLITLTGTNLIFLGGIVLCEDDMLRFSELVSMFSAKKLLDSMTEDNSIEYGRSREKSDKTTYDEIIAELKKLRGNKDEEDNDK